MTIEALNFTPQTLKRELIEQSITHWNEMIHEARSYLLNQTWQQAAKQYWRVYPIAEQLLKESFCKNCAIKGYIRTLVELAYVLRKNQQQEKLSAIMELAKPLWLRELNPVLIEELIAIVTNITYAPIAQIDIWMEGLFAMDEAVNQPLH